MTPQRRARRHRRARCSRRLGAAAARRATPTTCCAAAASCAATSTARSRGAAGRRRGATFATSYVEHAYIEPEAGYAEIVAASMPAAGRSSASASSPARRRRTWIATRSPACCGFEPEQVHIVPSAIGGGFGGKLDLVDPAAARGRGLEAQARRCACVYTRPESMLSSTKRHPARMQARVACDATGGSSRSTSPATSTPAPTRRGAPTVANRVPIHASRARTRVPNVRALTRAVLHATTASPARSAASACRSRRCVHERAARRARRAAAASTALEFRASQRARRRRQRRRPGRCCARASACAPCLDALRPAWTAATQAAARLQRRRRATRGRRCAAAPASPACGTASATP